MAKVDILNYISDSNILRSTYDTDTNELDITDVPQNLNSVITLGQGGGGTSYTGTDIATHNFVGDIQIDGTTIIDNTFAYSHITSVYAPDFVGGQVMASGFRGCAELVSADFPLCYRLQDNTFRDCTSLKTINFPSLKYISMSSVFSGCISLEMACFPVGGNSADYIETGLGNNFFEGCTSLKSVDVAMCKSIGSNCFKNCTSLETVVLRRSSMASLGNVNAFEGVGRAVDIYVPSALISSYENGTNWVDVTGATLTFKAIEGSYYETHHIDGTTV